MKALLSLLLILILLFPAPASAHRKPRGHGEMENWIHQINAKAIQMVNLDSQLNQKMRTLVDLKKRIDRLPSPEREQGQRLLHQLSKFALEVEYAFRKQQKDILFMVEKNVTRHGERTFLPQLSPFAQNLWRLRNIEQPALRELYLNVLRGEWVGRRVLQARGEIVPTADLSFTVGENEVKIPVRAGTGVLIRPLNQAIVMGRVLGAVGEDLAVEIIPPAGFISQARKRRLIDLKYVDKIEFYKGVDDIKVYANRCEQLLHRRDVAMLKIDMQPKTIFDRLRDDNPIIIPDGLIKPEPMRPSRLLH